LFFYDGKVYNLTNFISKHPGGKKALSNYTYKDITNILFRVYPHDKERTLDVLKQYIIGGFSDQKSIQVVDRTVTPQKGKNKRVNFFATDEDDEKESDSRSTFITKIKKGHKKQRS